VNVGDLVKQRELHSGHDDEFDCFILDEDKVCDELEDMMQEGGKLVDFHSCDFFPERWFDLVLVLRVDNTTLFDRLVKRGYSQKKVTENVECEIMEVVAQEARTSYAPEIVQELSSATVEDMESNVERVVAWLEQWKCSRQ
jgi:adenylate kinase